MRRGSVFSKMSVLAAAGLVVALIVSVAATGGAGASTSRHPAASTHRPILPEPSGYWVAGANGAVYGFDAAHDYSGMAGRHLAAPIVGLARTASSNGYWLVGADGGVFSFGDASFFGSMAGTKLQKPVVGMASAPDGEGYWLVASDGGVFALGDAAFNGSMGGRHLAAPVVGMSPTPTGDGYWLVGADGGVFNFGDATFHGAAAGLHLAAPIVGIAGTPDGNGYWLVGADGGVFAYGDATFYGSEGGTHLSAPVVGIAAAPGGTGYWLVGADGAVYPFGSAAADGSLAGTKLAAKAVGLASVGPTTGGRALLVGTFNGIPGQYATVQDAVDAAQPGDWILIAPGDYHESDDLDNPPSQSAIDAGWYGGVDIETPYIHLRGMDRSTVVIDGTKVGSPECSGAAADQDLGDEGTSGPIGRNGILIWKADGVSVQNLTVCNFLTTPYGNSGNEVWWNGGAESGEIGLTGYSGSYLTTTSTFDGNVGDVAASGNYGIFSSDSAGPGVWGTVYANNFTDSGMYIGACRQACDAWVHNATMENNAIGYSGTNSGGTVVIDHSLFDNNIDGFDTNTQSAGDPPPPQDGACPDNGTSGFTGTRSCWVFMDNVNTNNNNPDAPGYGALAQPVGTGMTVSGATYDTVMHNTYSDNGAWGLLIVPYPDTDPGPPGLCAASGGHLETSIGLGCVYDPKGDAVFDNTFSHNGYYGNPSNSDYGQITFFGGEPQNCYAGNVQPDGTAPDNLEQIQPTCYVGTKGPDTGGPLFDQVLCDTGFASLLGVSCTGDNYPTPGPGAPVIAPIPAEPTMANPCQGVPANAWCPGGVPASPSVHRAAADHADAAHKAASVTTASPAALRWSAVAVFRRSRAL